MEAERLRGEFVPYVAIDAPVYCAADKAGVVPELKGLLASQTAPELLATVLSRRLGREVSLEAPTDEVALPLLRWDTTATGTTPDETLRLTAETWAPTPLHGNVLPRSG